MSIEDICKKFDITDYIINSDNSIDVNGDVDLSGSLLYEIPLNFNRVEGNFYCIFNNLKSLKGSPKYVGKDFQCSYNELTSLEHCPNHIGGNFDFSDNCIRTLKHFPKRLFGKCWSVSNPIAFIFNNIDSDLAYTMETFKVIENDVVDIKKLKYVLDIFKKPLDIDYIKIKYKIKNYE